MTVDPHVRRFLDELTCTSAKTLYEVDVNEARKNYLASRRSTEPSAPPVAEVFDLTISEGLAVRIYRPFAERNLPGIIYFHGGGWVFGDLDSHDVLCRTLAIKSGCAVVAVDYRRAPEHPFPAAVEDAWFATRWIGNNGRALNIDASRLALAGDSAGGTLAAAAAIHARDDGWDTIRLQALLYPITDMEMKSESHLMFSQGYYLTGASLTWFKEQYIRRADAVRDWRASPLRVPHVTGLAPAFVLTAEYDPLRDEGEAYALRLVREGIPVTLWRALGQVHGFLPMGRVFPLAETGLLRAAAALQAALCD